MRHTVTAAPTHLSLFCNAQVYQDLCVKHPTFRERSERVDLSVRGEGMAAGMEGEVPVEGMHDSMS